ncbi:MAG: hypothetical protein KC516_00795 [Nanoarchaeota archaeon]|nr:hypothetical protein [Nanoarchaeota archaeon]
MPTEKQLIEMWKSSFFFSSSVDNNSCNDFSQEPLKEGDSPGKHLDDEFVKGSGTSVGTITYDPKKKDLNVSYNVD